MADEVLSLDGSNRDGDDEDPDPPAIGALAADATVHTSPSLTPDPEPNAIA